MPRVWCALFVLFATGTVIAGPSKKPKSELSAAEQELATFRKQEGAAFDQFLDYVVKIKKQLDEHPDAAGSAASQVETFIGTMSVQLNMAMGRALRPTDTMPTRLGPLTGAQMLKEFARVRREVSDFAVKYGDKAARRARLTGLERAYDWQQRQPAAMAAYEASGRLRFALALATSRVEEAARFEKFAAETKRLGGATDTTPLKLGKTTIPLSAAVAEVKKLGRQAQKDQQRLQKLAAEEQKRADAAHRAALLARAAPSPARAPQPAPVWREAAVSAPLQTMEGSPPVEASPEAAAEEAAPPEEQRTEAAPAAQAAAPPAAPACNQRGATCGNTNPPDNPCCPGTTCSSRFQYSDGSLGIGYCQ